MILHLDQENFGEVVKEGKVLVDFYAEWCGPCKMMGPVLSELASERSDIKIVKVDIDQHEDLARQYGVMSVPTIFLFENGEVKKQDVGYKPKEILESWLS